MSYPEITIREVGIVMLCMLNIIGFLITAADKYKARKRHWRIPEKVFFYISLMGGVPGVYSGLLLFKHKTRHKRFMWGLPAILAAQLVLVYFLFFKSILSI